MEAAPALTRGRLNLDPERRVLIDGVLPALPPAIAAAQKACVFAYIRYVKRNTTTLVTGLRVAGMIAPMVLDKQINRDWFAQVLLPQPRLSEISIMNNLSSHKRAAVNDRSKRSWRSFAFFPPLRIRL